jgi:signal transduction histidine kinase
MAHELGTPVHLLLNAFDLIDDAKLPNSGKEWIDTARRAAEWLARSVVQLDDAARFRTRPLRLRCEDVEIDSLAGDLVAQLLSMLGDRRLAVTAPPAGEGATLRGDRFWLRRALWNLLTNAVRFTPDGGSIVVAAAIDNDAARIEVSDTGVGIGAAEIEEIFEPFSSATGDPLLHGSGALGFGVRGLGLGLAVVRRIARAHGGDVAVSSALGIGSRFTLLLPRAGAGSRDLAG